MPWLAVHTWPSRPLPTTLASTDVDGLFGRLMRISLTLSGVDPAFTPRLFSPSGILNIRKLKSGQVRSTPSHLSLAPLNHRPTTNALPQGTRNDPEGLDR